MLDKLMSLILTITGLQDGRLADLLYQSDADHHEQAAPQSRPQQVNFLLAGGQ